MKPFPHCFHAIVPPPTCTSAVDRQPYFPHEKFSETSLNLIFKLDESMAGAKELDPVANFMKSLIENVAFWKRYYFNGIPLLVIYIFVEF